MIKKVTQSIVNQMGSGPDLVPVHSILDQEQIRPLCLVTIQEKKTFQKSPHYRWAHFRLEDVLLPGEDGKSIESFFPKEGRQDPMQFTVTKSSSDRVDGNLSFPVEPANIEMNAAASSSKEWSIKLEMNHIPVREIQALNTKRKINMNHSFIHQLQKSRERLYVVYETIETSEDATCKASTEIGGGIKTWIQAKLCAKGTREKKRSITIPKGCTLAFRAIPLDITDGSWDLDHFANQNRTLFESDGFSKGKLGELEVEVRETCQILSKLSLEVSAILLKAIKAVMRDRNLFQELTQKMEAVLHETGSCELKTETPDLKHLLSILQYSSRQLLLQMAEAIAYTLDALDELTEDQLLLLLESLEEKIVPQQLKLVASILEHNIEQQRHFRVDPSLLSFSQEKEQELTIAMVEMSGVTLQKDGSVACIEDAFPALAALCVSLYVLHILNK